MGNWAGKVVHASVRAAGVVIGIIAGAGRTAGRAVGTTARVTAAAAKAPAQAAVHAHSAVVSTKPVQAARGVSDSPHTGVLWAAWRQGLQELGEAFGKATPESISVTMPGQIGQPVSQDVWQEKGGRGPFIPE